MGVYILKEQSEAVRGKAFLIFAVDMDALFPVHFDQRQDERRKADAALFLACFHDNLSLVGVC